LLSNNSLVSKDQTTKIKIEDIKIGERFRSEIGDINELVESIKNNGLLCPITVTKHGLAQLRNQSNFNNISSEEKEVS
jgi:ParB-like chromosome segregation protein Spo0J